MPKPHISVSTTCWPLIVLLLASNVAAQTRSSNKPKASFTGHYRLHREEFRNRLEVQELPGRKIKFHLLALWVSHYNPENIHNGEVWGVLDLKDGVAVYEAANCKITMKFMGNIWSVMQSDEAGDCDFGANVTATGSYKRINSKKPKFDF